MFTTKEQLESVLTAMLDSGTIEEHAAIILTTGVESNGGLVLPVISKLIASRDITPAQATLITRAITNLKRAAK